MSCGCSGRTYSPFPSARCVEPTIVPVNNPYSGPQAVVLLNFTTPAANTDVQIAVSSTEGFYVGQGIKIGLTYYQIYSIIDSSNMVVRHNGLGATVGAVIVAVHPITKCYQYPIYLAGAVPLGYTPAIGGYDNAGISAAGVSLVGSIVARYEFFGPTTVKVSASFQATVADTVAFVGLTLPPPVPAAGVVRHTQGSASYRVAAGNLIDIPVVSRHFNQTILYAGAGNGVLYPNISNGLFAVSAIYEAVA